MKLGTVINEFAKKAGLDLTKIKDLVEELNNSDKQIDDEVAAQLQQNLLTESEAESRFMSKHKKGLTAQGSKEAWDTIDRVNAKFYAMLSDDEKKKHDELKSTQEKTDFLMGHFADRKSTDKDAQALRKANDELIANRDKDYVPKTQYSELEAKYNPKKEKAFYSEFTLDAVTNSKISETFKAGKRFKNNLKTDFDQLLSKKGWTVDMETGEYLDKEGLPALNGNEKITNTDILDLLIEENEDYQKKSNGRPANIEVELPGGKINGKVDSTTAFNFGNFDRK